MRIWIQQDKSRNASCLLGGFWISFFGRWIPTFSKLGTLGWPGHPFPVGAHPQALKLSQYAADREKKATPALSLNLSRYAGDRDKKATLTLSLKLSRYAADRETLATVPENVPICCRLENKAPPLPLKLSRYAVDREKKATPALSLILPQYAADWDTFSLSRFSMDRDTFSLSQFYAGWDTFSMSRFSVDWDFLFPDMLWIGTFFTCVVFPIPTWSILGIETRVSSGFSIIFLRLTRNRPLFSWLGTQKCNPNS